MADFDPFASGLATPVEAQAPAKQESFDPFSSGQAEELTTNPRGSAAKDFFQRLGEDLWKGVGSTIGGLERLGGRIAGIDRTPLTPQQIAYNQKVSPNHINDLDLGAAISSVGDFGPYRRTDPARDQGLPALAASIIGQAAPPLLAGPAAPLAMGAQIGENELRQSLAAGESPELANARFDLGVGVGTPAALIPVVGKSIATKALTGAAGNLIGDVAIEKAQGRELTGRGAAQAAGVGALFGAGVGVQQKIAQPKLAPAKPSFSIVSAMDAEVAGNPTLANSNANAIAMRPVEAPATAQPSPVPDAAPVDSTPAVEITPSVVAKMTPDEFNAFQVERNITEEAQRVGQAATTPEQISYLAEQGKLANAEAKRLVAEKDFDTLAKVMTREQFFNEAHQAATKSVPFATDSLVADGTTKTKAELLKEIAAKNPGADIEAPKQLLQKGKYEVRDVFIDEIGEVFGKSTIQPEVVARYEKTPSSDPIILAEVDGVLRPVDGKHRLTAAQNRGDATIKAYVPVDVATGRAAATAESAPVMQPATEAFKLPANLAKSNPRYSFGQNKFEVRFESDLDKALYILAGESSKSKADPKFLNLVTEATGMTEAEARAAGRTVRDQIKMMAREGSDGDVLTLPAINEVSPTQTIIPAATLREVVPQANITPESFRKLQRDVAMAVRNARQNPEPKPIEPLVSPTEVQKFADDMEVAEITGEVGTPIVPPPPPTPPNAFSPAPGSPEYRPGLTSVGLGIGKVAEGLKILAGTIEGNIRDASKRIFGVLRNYEHAKSKLSLQFETMTMPASRLARKILTPKGNDTIGNMLMSGKVDEAKALVAKDTRYGPEFSKAIDDVRAALDYAHSLSTEARDTEVPYLKDYFPRQLIDYAKFREFLGKQELSVADAAIRRAQERAEGPLTKDQIENVLNNLISQSRMNGGKPGYLKSRTIKEIDDNISRFYEPWDVALENHLRKVTNDVVNRSYFGKAADGAQWNPQAGNFGKVLAEEIESGRLKGKSQSIVIDNLQDRFRMEQPVSGWAAEFGRKIRFAQSAAYLGQIQTAVAQFGDIFGSILHQGPVDTARGYANRRFSLRDIGIHEGNVETAQFSRQKGWVDKAADLTIKFGVGLSDQFNKGGVANAIQRHYAEVVKKGGVPLDNLIRDYSAKFPEKWPQMLKELQSPEFQRGEVGGLPEAQFFLYNEMADIHPINPSGMAQGFNAAHPLAKPMWGLKSYMIKQLDIMRARGYEKLKSPDRRIQGEGLSYLAAYAAIVAAGQNFAVSWLRDKLADRESDTSDYFVGGFLQPLGISRYTITQLKQGEVGKAMVETALPIVSLAREGINDVGVFRDWLINRRDKKTRQRTVPNLGEVVNQSELIKHFPVVGSLYYSRVGKGADKEKERRQKKAKGQGQPNTVETISDIFMPEETASR